MDEKEILINQLKSAYRKYKSYAYYDNYSSIQREDVARFELEHFYDDEVDFKSKFNEYFKEFAKILCSDEFEDYMLKLINQMEVISFPKILEEDNEGFISNCKKPKNNISKIHYFIDLPVECHILGVLWILRCGYLIDEELDNHCYGNRINENFLKKLNEEEYYDFSTFLFNPYYKNYQSWRDNGLNSVNKLLDDNQNVIMLSLDFKDYFYRSLIDFDVLLDDISRLKDESCKEFTDFDDDIDKKLNFFIENVFKSYSSKFIRSMPFDSNNNKFIITEEYYKNLYMIPLGFLPSLIISNWNLNGFDKSIMEKTHPFYYGRYVDDILMVFGFQENSHTNCSLNFEKLDSEEFLRKYFTPNNLNPLNNILKCSDGDKSIFKVFNVSVSNNMELFHDYRNLEIQKEKLKIYKFYPSCSDAIIKNFRKEIFKNSSEFRMMHDFDSILDDIEENIYKIDYKDSINKLNDIKDVKISKYEISKLLSRLNLSSKNISDFIDEDTMKKVLNAFNSYILEYMILWEKIFVLLYINNQSDKLISLTENIIDLIDNLEVVNSSDFFLNYNNDNNSHFSKNLYNDEYEVKNLKKSLFKFLYSSLIRTLSLKSFKYEDYKYIFNKLNDYFEISSNNLEEFVFKDISCYIFSLMYNNSLMKYPLQNNNEIFNDINNLNEKLSYNFIKSQNQGFEIFNGIYPRFIKLNEFIFNEISKELFGNNEINIKDNVSKYDVDNYIRSALNYYEIINFNWDSWIKRDNSLFKELKFDCKARCDDKCCPKLYEEYDINVLNIGNKVDKIKIGLLNTKLDNKYLKDRLNNNPNLNHERFDKIKKLINESINKKVKLLLMPEMYIPYEWVDEIVKISKDHQMAIIFGVEPIVNGDEVGNYIMASLPFLINDKYYESLLVYRLKNYYSPYELKEYKKYDKDPIECKNNIKYYMFIWNDIYIAPYYCFEIANITDRGIFKGCCDILTVSEFNKDTNYFNNIAESLSRDLFCYCIKSNTSHYGGTVILQPSSSEDKYLVNLKGGKDDYIVTHNLNVKKLREAANENDEYTCESYFKPKPPGFNKHRVRKRMGIN